jgi:hypothetical protein
MAPPVQRCTFTQQRDANIFSEDTEGVNFPLNVAQAKKDDNQKAEAAKVYINAPPKEVRYLKNTCDSLEKTRYSGGPPRHNE